MTSKAVARALRMARTRKADGGAAFGTGSPAEEAEKPSGLASILGGAYNTLGNLSKRAIQGAAQYQPGSDEIPKETIAPAIETALSMAGIGMPFAQKSAAGIFGGKLAQTADHAALAKAEKMAADGADRHAIWNETGWFQGSDKKWRFEIPDDSLSVRKGYGAGIEFGAGESWGRSAPKIEHSDLTAAYPGKFDYLAHDVKIGRGMEPQGRFMPEGPGRNEEFYYSDKPVLPTLFVESPTTKQARSIAAHELQHAVQGTERFAAGANPELMRSALSREKPQPTYDDLFGAYQRAAGEVEARNVQNRLNMTPEQRRATPPWQTEDVPMNEQIVRAGGGRIRTALKMATGGNAPFAGYIHGSTGGRTDNKPIDVAEGSYVIPADILSGLGEGNSHAGWAALQAQFGMDKPAIKAEGGAIGQPVPIVAAAGEGVIPPDRVAEIGGGDLERGHSILDAMVSHVRKKTIKTLRKLPKPKKS